MAESVIADLVRASNRRNELELLADDLDRVRDGLVDRFDEEERDVICKSLSKAAKACRVRARLLGHDGAARVRELRLGRLVPEELA